MAWIMVEDGPLFSIFLVGFVFITCHSLILSGSGEVRDIVMTGSFLVDIWLNILR